MPLLTLAPQLGLFFGQLGFEILEHRVGLPTQDVVGFLHLEQLALKARQSVLQARRCLGLLLLGTLSAYWHIHTPSCCGA